VRLFLGALVGFLGTLIVLLLLFLWSFLENTSDAIADERQTIANIAANEIGGGIDPTVAEVQLSAIRARHGVAGAAIVAANGHRVVSGVVPDQEGVSTVTRTTPAGTLVLVFDDGRMQAMRRTFYLTAAVSLSAVAAGVLLLVLYLPRITRPIEQMLDSAAEISERAPHVPEQEYLIETFRTSIDLLKAQKQELQNLHDAQKVRADDLERVTAALTRSLTSGFLAVDPQHEGLGAGRDDDGVGLVGRFGRLGVADPDLERALARIEPADLGGQELGAETGRLGPEVAHELGAHDPVDKAREVLDLGGEHELTAGLIGRRGQFTLDHQRRQVGARGVDGRGEAGRPRSDDDDVAEVQRSYSLALRPSASARTTGQSP